MRSCRIPAAPLTSRFAATPSPRSPTSAARAELGPNFVYLPDGEGEHGCLPGDSGGDALANAVLEAQASLGLDVDLAVVLSTDPLSCSSIYYSPRKNDVRGIGYRHTRFGEVFDHHPGSALQGVVFLNDLPYWEEYPEEFASAFLHEIGHRWLAFPHALIAGAELDLTGRERSHWSYFFDSHGSPLEGNAFAPGDTATTATPVRPTHYAPVDLYLMGVLPPEEVGPLRFLTNAHETGSDCNGGPVYAASPPQRCEPKTLDGTWVDFDVDALIAAEGPRLPAADGAPQDLRVAFFVFAGAASTWNPQACERVAPLLDARIADFARATSGRMNLTNVVQGGSPCEQLSYPLESPSAGTRGCSTVPGPRPAHLGLAAYALSALWLVRRARQRHARTGVPACRCVS